MQRTAQTTVMLTLTSAFIIGSVTAFGDTPENIIQTGDSSTPLMLQMQNEPESPSVVAQLQHHELFGNAERTSTFMFNGITLNEKQRQQLRDLMATQRRYQFDNPVSMQEREALHNLIIADDFDEKAVRDQLEKHMQKELAQRVEMARIHHELYQLLTPEQKAQLEQIHKQKMSQFQALQ
ncbi:Spy/CpxP family protein refolding chaperone [Providencia sp. PROV149]|uniref:Spy/CpxP family protein refolding chaperone n=1 Tax=Providencia sp. PROV149 TaxID=2949859 RepID=UPI00234ACC47|nr:Spy/CpxP family protein refolding chaperone [Providencia sp. PROV149]